jgi:hypothetical protein
LRLLSEETENDEENAGLAGRSDHPDFVEWMRRLLPDSRALPLLPV